MIRKGVRGHGKKMATGSGSGEVCQKREKLVHFNVFQVDSFFPSQKKKKKKWTDFFSLITLVWSG